MKPELGIREKRINDLRMQIEVLNLQLDEAENLLEYHLLILENEDLLYEEE